MGATVKSYRDLLAWQKSRVLVSDIYAISRPFPKEEMYGLTIQIRRAAISIPSNIAEGSSRRSSNEFIRFLNIAYGSLMEVETQLFLAMDQRYIPEREAYELLEKTAEMGRMMNGLIGSLEHRVTELRTPNSDHYDYA